MRVTSQVASALVSLPTSLIEIVLEYYVSFETLNYRSDRLERAGNESIQGNMGAFAVRNRDGSVSCWGHKAAGGKRVQLKNVKALCTSWGKTHTERHRNCMDWGIFSGAFAAILGDEDTVVCWGDKEYGGDCSAVASELKQVEGICGSSGAFAALKRDGTVTSWGHADYGGDCSLVRDRLKGVKAIYSTRNAFAAVLHDGSVEAWGSRDYGGWIDPEVQARLKQVKCISGNGYAFAALLSDGTVETWGDEHNGGDSSTLRASNQLTQVEAICGCIGAFAALRKNGTVVCWGDRGGWRECWVSSFSKTRCRVGSCADSGVLADLQLPHFGMPAPGPSHLEELNRANPVLDRVVAISSSCWAFAALRSDGSVATWGRKGFLGGDSFSVVRKLKEVVAIRGNHFAFAALRQDGTVTTWGDQDSGGDSSEVRHELVGVMALGSSGRAFAAWRNDGAVVTWGDPDAGGTAGVHRKKKNRRCIIS